MSPHYLIGVDGGGTRTRCVLCDGDGQVLRRGESGSSNLYGAGIGPASAAILEAIRGALEGTGITPSGCGLGLAGAHSPAEIVRLREALAPGLADIMPRADVAIEEDAVAAWAGAFGGEPGIICIAGTGANAFGIGPDGGRARADGLGPLLGDRGSGIRIGEAALRAACAAHDGVGPETALLPVILAHFGVSSVEELVGAVYAPGFSRADLAGLVPPIATAAKLDLVARGILKNAGQDLAASVTAVARQLKFEAQVPVAYIGGVLENVPMVRESFESALQMSLAGRVLVQPPRFEPVVGAAFLPALKKS